MTAMRHRNSSGFTLIELLIVMTIVAILVTVAFPSYRAFIVRGHQAGAQEFLLDVLGRASQFRLDARAYPTDLGDAAGELDLAIPEGVSDYYTVTVTANNAATPPSFVVTATPRAGTVQADAATLALSADGRKSPTEVWK